MFKKLSMCLWDRVLEGFRVSLESQKSSTTVSVKNKKIKKHSIHMTPCHAWLQAQHPNIDLRLTYHRAAVSWLPMKLLSIQYSAHTIFLLIPLK